MIENNYKIGKHLNNMTKYNITFDRIQILNLVCSNYVEDILKQGDTFSILEEEKHKLLVLIDKLLK
jgi:hypothetical protein